MTDNTQNTFVAQLKADSKTYQDSTAQEEYCAKVREQASEHFLELLLSSESSSKNFQDLALHRNRCGQKTVRLTQWQGRGPTYLDQSLADLLDRADLLQRMQDYLDVTYGAGEFCVFNHRIRGNRNRSVSLTVSWNKEEFEKAGEIIAQNRLKAQERQERQEKFRGEGHDDEDEEDELAPRRGGNRFEKNDGPPRRRYDSGPPRRRYDDNGPPRRRNDDSGPPRRRNDDSGHRSESSGRDAGHRAADDTRPSRRRVAVSSYDN